MSQEHPILECGSVVCITTDCNAGNFVYLGRVDYTGHRFVVLSDASTVDYYSDDREDCPPFEKILQGKFAHSKALFLGVVAVNIDHILDVTLWPHKLPTEKATKGKKKV